MMIVSPNNPNKITSLIVWCLLFIFSVIFFCGCSPERKLHRAEKKLQKLIANFPELIRKDTIYKVDTTIINGVQHDTIIKAGITTDTLVIKEKHLTYKYFNNGKTVYLKGVCDTVIVTKKIPYIVNSVSVKPLNRKERFIMWVAANLALIILILMGLFWVLKKIIKVYNPIEKIIKWLPKIRE